jgi:hypothetical protein
VVAQITKNSPLDALQTALSAQFPAAKVREIFYHYDALARSARLGDYEACLLSGGKFVEATLKCLHYRRTHDEVDSIKVEDEVNMLEKAPTLNVSERMTIPRTLRLIYEHRNRRGGAHNNSFDPNEMDSAFVVAAAKWVLEELTRLYLTNDPAAAHALVANLLVKETPLVEEIDDDLVILQPELSARVQLEVLLYRHFPNRCTVRDLAAWVRHHHTEHNVRVTLGHMRAKALAHENEKGWKLTEQGVHEAETEIAKIKHGSNEVRKKRTTRGTRTKGVKRGRN